MSFKKNYKPLKNDVWQGRIDGPLDPNSYRWHQVVELIDISKDEISPMPDEIRGFCFIGFCCDKGVELNKGRSGTSKAPISIRRELSNLPKSFNEQVKIFDAGNIHCFDGNLAHAQEDLSQAIHKILLLNLFPVVLGGGHEIAFGHYEGLLSSRIKQNKKPAIGIVNFDAHFDLRPYDNGINSGTMFLQIADKCKERKLDFSYFCLGIQKTGNTQNLFNKAHDLNVQYVLAKDIQDSSLSDTMKKIDVFTGKHDDIYLTICADVFSSAYAPGVSAPQPFGLLPEITLTLIKHVVKSGKVASFDIAEVSPRFDEDNRTAKLVAIVVYAVINTMIES